MIQILEQPDKNFKITIINTLKALMKKVDSSHEQRNFSKEIETLGKSQMKILEIVLKYSNNKNISEIKNSFNTGRLTRRLDTAKQRISELIKQ